MIELRDIRKVFNQGRPSEFVALREVSLSIDAHRLMVLKGPSGSGKTTLLSIIGCMARPTSGRIRLSGTIIPESLRDQQTEEAVQDLQGIEVTSLPERFLTEIRRITFGFIFQQFNLIRGLTAIENIMVPAYPVGEKHSLLRQRAGDLLDFFSLSRKASSRVEWLSGGETQRVAIARALINDPSVIIADEPTAHLDTGLSYEFMNTMERLKDEGKTVLIASHDPIVYASDIVDRVVGMRDGTIVSAGIAE